MSPGSSACTICYISILNSQQGWHLPLGAAEVAAIPLSRASYQHFSHSKKNKKYPLNQVNLNNSNFTRPGDHTLCLKLEGTHSHKLIPTQNTWNTLLISCMPYQHIQRTILITQAKQVDPWQILLDVRSADNRNCHT